MVWQILKITQSQAEIIKQGLAGTKVEEVQETVMNQPNYLGEDENKKLWSLKAKRAVQVGDLNSGTTQLTSVIANTLSLKDSKVDYFADEGDFISAEEKIVLRGNVKIKSDKLELSTQTLDYNLKTGYAESKTQVDILADFGNIIGDSMQSYDNAEKIVLIGNVRAKLYNKQKDKFVKKTVLVLLSLFVATSVYAQDVSVDVTSNMLEVERNSGTATFTGDVKALYKNVTLTSQSLKIFYDEKSKSKNKIKVIEAKDDVILIQGTDKVTAEKAEYFVEKNLIVFTKNVVLNRNGNILKGDHLVMNTITKQAKMRSTGKSRVKAVYFNNDKN